MNSTAPASRPGVAGWAAPIALFCIGLSATFYGAVGEFADLEIRPVHLAPLVIGAFVLPFLPIPRVRSLEALLVVPCLWATYMFLRHGVTGGEGFGIGARAVVCVVAYLTALTLACHSGKSGPLLAGLAVGCLVSVTCAINGITIADMTPMSASGRWEGFMPGANTLGSVAAIVLLASFALWCSRRALPWRPIAMLGVVIGIMGLLGSGSRGALFAAVASIIVLIAATNLAKGKPAISVGTLLSVLGVILTTAVLLYCFRNVVPDRLATLVESSDEAIEKLASDPRLILFRRAWEFFLDSPVIGAGSEAYAFHVKIQGLDRELCAHNTYLAVLATSGAVGFALFVFAPIFMGFQLLRIVSRRSAPMPPAAEHQPEQSIGTVPRAGIRVDAAAAPVRGCSPESLRLGAARALAMLVFVCAHNFVIVLHDSIHVWLVFAVAAHTCVEASRFRVRRERGSSAAPLAHRHSPPHLRLPRPDRERERKKAS